MLRRGFFRFSLGPMLALLFFSLTVGIGVQPAVAKKTGRVPAQAKASSSEPVPGQINAKSAVLAEVTTGTILMEQNADEIIEPASFTKVLTLYLVFEALQQGLIHLDDQVWISETAWRTGGSKMFVGVGTKVSLEELIKGVAVVSGNDACVALAEHLHGSVDAFVDAMNRKASELGMKNSHFLNPHGLPAEGQVTTARDMATLDVAYLKRFPESLRFHSMKEFEYNSISQNNRNRLLLKDSSVDGLKTGYVAVAGYHLAGTAQREGMRLLAVVMGASAPAVREREALRLLNYGFRHYTMVQPFPPGQPVANVKVWKGIKDSLSLFPVEAAAFLIAQAQKSALRWEVTVPTEVTAPIEASQTLGQVVFYVSDEPKKSVALASHENVARAGWAKVAWQTVIRVDRIDWRWAGGIAGGIVLFAGLYVLISNRRSSKRFKSFS